MEVAGAKRYTPAEVVMLSGLAPGTSVTTAHFDAATKLMASTGLFAEISYRYATVAGKTTVTFAIQEPDWNMPVILDNFVWFKDDEIVAALRQEGAAYATERIAWHGNGVMQSRELDSLMPLKAGEVANVSKLDDGMRRVQAAYGKQGYILLNAAYTPRLDDEKKQVAFDVKIEEGPQFRFGTLTFPGLAPDAVETLSKRWRLKAGDVFDASYPFQFFVDDIRPRLRQGVAPPSYQTQVDEQNRVVNVKFVFGG